MVNILDLAPDTLSSIISLNRSRETRGYDRMSRTKELSTVCRAFNAVCAQFIFRKFKLYLRDMRFGGRPSCTPWDPEFARERLAVLDSKGAWVRELTLFDAQSGDVPALPDEFMPELMKSLKSLPGLTSFTLFTRNVERPVPAELWNLIRDQRDQIKSLTFIGHWTPPAGEDTDPIDGINSLTLEPLCIQTKPFLKLVKTPELRLVHEYFGYGGEKADLYPFKPSAEDTHLRRIDVDIYRRGGSFQGEPTEHIYDFTQVLQTKVKVSVHGLCEYKMHIPSTWKCVKKVLPKLFVDDLSTFDVSRVGGSPEAIIVREPREGWTPVNQVHLEGQAQDDKEQRDMARYYRWKTCMQLGI
ncbi:hypothetical protein DFH11DRAFT_1829422 [Phellopilus nigrolimitatus]|nr:hypothetical protein DFH11DRAFT_1829422 [Phellopilus nigrolimitatus]